MAHKRHKPDSQGGKGLGSGFASLVEAEKLMQVAFVLPTALVICWFLGWWLAGKTHMRWIEIAGIVFGCIVGLVYVIQMAVAVEKKTSVEDESQNEIGKERPNGRQ
jgi:ATP synthase protein I